MGLLSDWLMAYGISAARLKNVYRLFAIACLPAYLLSVLWLRLPFWVYSVVIAAVLLQIAAWIIMLRLIRPALGRIKNGIPVVAQRVLLLSAIAVTIKLFLQAGSVIPSLSDMAFGFRPIVIGYLHLVLLGMISLFIAGYVIAEKYVPVTKLTIAGLTLFVLGILFNEILLMIQGAADLRYVSVPYVNGLLLLVALLLFAGITVFNYGMQKSLK